jgi:RecG-like helicase
MLGGVLSAPWISSFCGGDVGSAKTYTVWWARTLAAGTGIERILTGPTSLLSDVDAVL